MRFTLPSGTVLAGFRVQALVGEGAMGAVYVAEDLAAGRRVALKLLAPELARDERFRQRFLRESSIAAGLEHPNVVPIVTSGEEDGVLYLVMAYIEGADLRELLRREGRLEPKRALAIVRQVADALDKAHASGLVHRDVKPGNILVTAAQDGERAYVCDFGLARHVSSVSSLTGERGFVGTIDYVPPEQIEGGQIDGRTDVYSLGCVLYECLAGVRPFDRESELSVVFAHLNEPPPRLSDVRPDLPEAFDGVFATALAKSPNERYATCGELAKAAAAAVQGKTFARRKLHNRRLLVTAALLVATVAVLGASMAVRRTHTDGHPQVLALRSNAISLVDARTRRVVGHVGLGRRVDFADVGPGIVFSGRMAWISLFGEQRLEEVDSRTRRPTRVVRLPWSPGDLATGGGSVWVRQDNGPEVVGIDTKTGNVARRFSVAGGGGGGIAYGDGSLWLAGGPGILRVGPRNGHVLRRISTVGQPSTLRWFVFADGSLWAARPDNGLVLKIDPLENRVTATAKLHGWLSDLSVGGGFVWVSLVPDGVVFKLTEEDLSVQGTASAGADPESISTGGGYVWAANSAARSVTAVTQASGHAQRLAAATEPTRVRYHGGLLWIGSAPQPTALPPISGQELRVSTPTSSFNDDPAHAGIGDAQIWYATCANLLNYPDSAGADGARLQPEVAAAMPRVSRDGRTYTFRIRRGFRFSPPSNETLTAETFRHTIERTLSPEVQHAWPLVPDIAGLAGYRLGEAAHISGIAVHNNSLSITLVRPAGDFLTRISMPSFCAVPLSEPVTPSGPTIPSAGPYYIASSESSRTVLLRNPNYGGARPRRAERIVYTSFIPTPQAVALVDKGDIDYLPPDFDGYSLLAPGGVLDARHGPRSPAARGGKQRYFPQPLPFVDYIAFNTRRPLFRDVRLRRAVNYVLDRRALAAASDASPADEILPPGVPGYLARHFYPLAGPDLASARQLAGGRRRHAVLYLCGEPARVAQIVRSNLAQIRIGLKILESRGCLQGPDPKAKRADLVFEAIGLGPADRDPAAFFDMAIGGAYDYPRPGPGPWHGPAFRGRLERARVLRGRARTAAYAALNAELAHEAPFAVYGIPLAAEYFSPKVGCKLFQAEYHVVDLGALCMRRGG
jgi:ABC-type oligopeptide transport system substrate-binding subunit/tRNA A-37 threonylcarbamoyl transferase component Bud32